MPGIRTYSPQVDISSHTPGGAAISAVLVKAEFVKIFICAYEDLHIVSHVMILCYDLTFPSINESTLAPCINCDEEKKSGLVNFIIYR